MMKPAARILMLGMAFAAACRGGLQPVSLPVDRVDCAKCGMLISDVQDAAEVVFDDRDPVFYDDLGCLAADRIVSRGRFEMWVRVDEGSAWRKAREAFYARPAGARTPMGYGIVAFSSAEKARARDREGRARTWREVERESPVRPERSPRGAPR